jgi:predicted ferric reductase
MIGVGIGLAVPWVFLLLVGLVGLNKSGLKCGGVLVGVGFVLMLVLRYLGYAVDYPAWSKGLVHSAFFRSLGELNFVTLGFVLFPVARNSIWSKLLGISFDRAIVFHQFIAYIAWVVMLVHGAGMVYVYAENDPDWTSFVFKFSKNPRTGWSNLSGLICFVFLSWQVLISSITAIRRKYFELFYFSHILCFPLIFLFAILHMPAIVGYFALALLLYFVDLFGRIYMNRKTKCNIASIEAIELEDSTQIVVLKLQDPLLAQSSFISNLIKKYKKSRAGQFYFLSIPSISSLESHPFSLSCSPQHENLQFHIKSNGENSWTGKLFQIAKSGNTQIEAYFNGGYGKTEHDLTKFKGLFLIAGGFAVTPCISILEDILLNRKTWTNLENITFVWICKDASHFSVFRPLLDRAVSEIGMRCELWVGRKPLNHLLTGENCAVFVSGPPSLVSQVKSCGLPICKESFSL